MILSATGPLSGNLKDVPLSTLLHFLKFGCKTGILTVRRNLLLKSIHFQNGDILFATSNYPNDYLGALLLRAGKINFKQYELAEEYLKTTGKTQGAIFVEQGFIKPKDLFEALVTQVREILFSLFLWENALYNFKEVPLATEQSIGLSIDADEIVQEGLMRISDWTRLVGLLPPLDLILKKNPVQLSKPLKRSSNDNFVFNLIDDQRSIRDILTLASTMALSCAQILNVLIAVEILIPAVTVFKKTEETEENIERQKKSNETQQSGVIEEEVPWDDLPTEVRIQKIREVYAKISFQNYYQILNVTPRAAREDVKRAYFKLAKRFHPDRYRGGDLLGIEKEIEFIFIYLTRAYDTLLMDDKRSEYDKSLASPFLQKPSEEKLVQELFDRAESAYLANDLKNAIYFLEEIIRLLPESPENWAVYLRYGQILSRMPGKLREAVDAFRKSATLDSSKARPYVELGLAYGKAGLATKSAVAFQEALKREPDNKLAREELAKIG